MERRNLSNERPGRSIPIEIIDETTKGNVLSDPSRPVCLTRKKFWMDLGSTEGFSESFEEQEKIAKFIANTFDIKDRGPTLDVGFGLNTAISETFAGQGIASFAIDARQHPGWKHEANMGIAFRTEQFWTPPFEVKGVEGVRIFSGDIALISEAKSQLKDQKFGLILFNGSWDSTGFNFTLASRHESRAGDKKDQFRDRNIKPLDDEIKRLTRRQPGHPGIYDIFRKIDKQRKLIDAEVCVEDYVSEGKDKTLGSCKAHIKKGGIIGIVSSRYAYWGGGYSFEDLPTEKAEFVDIYRKFTVLGAKRVYFVGMSQAVLRKCVAKAYSVSTDNPSDTLNPQESAYVEKLLGSSNLPLKESVVNLDEVFAEEAGRIRQMARIDAIFAEF